MLPTVELDFVTSVPVSATQEIFKLDDPICPRSPVRIISYCFSVTTGGNPN